MISLPGAIPLTQSPDLEFRFGRDVIAKLDSVTRPATGRSWCGIRVVVDECMPPEVWRLFAGTRMVATNECRSTHGGAGYAAGSEIEVYEGERFVRCGGCGTRVPYVAGRGL
jgi:hypothetical protein